MSKQTQQSIEKHCSAGIRGVIDDKIQTKRLRISHASGRLLIYGVFLPTIQVAIARMIGILNFSLKTEKARRWVSLID